VFGENPTSVLFINRSCQASGFAVLLVGIAYCRLNHDKLSLIGTLAFFALFANFFPDYMYLLVSRMIVKIMATRTSTKEIWLLLTGDTIATAFIALLSSFLAMLVLELSSYAETISWWKRTHGPDGSFTLYMFLHHWAGMLLWRASLKIRGWDWLSLRAPSGAAIFFYSAFFTSVWVWLYVLSLFLISLLHRGRTVWVKIAPYLDIEKKPLMAIGRVAGLVAGVAYSVLLGIVWLVRHWH
jgi:hypothetical protein